MQKGMVSLLLTCDATSWEVEGRNTVGDFSCIHIPAKRYLHYNGSEEEVGVEVLCENANMESAYTDAYCHLLI